MNTRAGVVIGETSIFSSSVNVSVNATTAWKPGNIKISKGAVVRRGGGDVLVVATTTAAVVRRGYVRVVVSPTRAVVRRGGGDVHVVASRAAAVVRRGVIYYLFVYPVWLTWVAIYRGTVRHQTAHLRLWRGWKMSARVCLLIVISCMQI